MREVPGGEEMSDLALPIHLRGKLHNDWPFPFNGIPRGWNAKGPREPKDSKDYLPWPPKLVQGKGVARWESARADSIILIPEFVTATIDQSIYGKEYKAIEMNPGRPDFQKEKIVRLDWEEAKVWDSNGTQNVQPDNYSPSALQKFSPKGWMKLEPFYHSEWRVLKKRELPVWPETGDDKVLFFRRGNRPDHADSYYNVDKIIPIGFVGLKWE